MNGSYYVSRSGDPGDNEDGGRSETREINWRELARDSGFCEVADDLDVAGGVSVVAGALASLIGGSGAPAIALGAALILIAAIIDDLLDC